MADEDKKPVVEDQETQVSPDEKEFNESWDEEDGKTPTAETVDDDANDLLGAETDPGKKNPPDDQAGILPVDEDADFDDMKAEAEKLQQRLRSAEGRLRNNHSEKLASEVEGMRSQLLQISEKLGITAPEPAGKKRDSQDDAEVIPDGFNAEEWEVFKADFPDNAKELQAKAQQNKQLETRLTTLEQEQVSRKQQAERNAFEEPILKAHPDYKTILAEQSDDVLAFVNAIADPIKREGALVVVQRGSASQIISLVTEYKASREAKAKTQTQKPASTRNPTAAIAVPSRGGAQPNVSKPGPAGKDDFKAAWEEDD